MKYTGNTFRNNFLIETLQDPKEINAIYYCLRLINMTVVKLDSASVLIV